MKKTVSGNNTSLRKGKEDLEGDRKKPSEIEKTQEVWISIDRSEINEMNVVTFVVE